MVAVKMKTKLYRAFSAIKLAWERAAAGYFGDRGFCRGWRFRVVMYCVQDGTQECGARQSLRSSARHDEYRYLGTVPSSYGHSDVKRIGIRACYCMNSSTTISAVANELVNPGISISNRLIILPSFLSPHDQSVRI